MLSCRTRSEHERWIESHMAVSCNDGVYQVFSAVAVALVVVVVAGLPVVCIAIMMLESRRTRQHFQQTFIIVGGGTDTEANPPRFGRRASPALG